MGLKDLRTNLKTLQFGKDTPGGGDSGLPYIKTSLPENSSPLEYIALESARYNSDYPIRGGLYAVRAVAEDAIRIRKFLTDFPKGSNFTLKQVGLQKSNPLIETGKNGGRVNTQTYNLNSNLLLSILTAGSGIHYPRSGATPLTLLDDNNKYFSIVGKKSTEDNRLVNLYKTKVLEESIDSSKLLNLGISSDENQIMSYIGGPDSLYGDGETTIFRATDHTGLPINTSKPNLLNTKEFNYFISSPTTSSLSSIGATYFLEGENIEDDILGISNDTIFEPSRAVLKTQPNIFSKEKYNIGEPVEDFRVNGRFGGEKLFSRDYRSNTINIENRVGIGSPGARPSNLRTNTNQIYQQGQDRVNLTPIYWGSFDKPVEQDPGTRDLIKFAFETIDNNNTNLTYRAHFRAYLKGFTDSNTADWDGKKYTGRGDDMYTYQGFNRNISFNFTVLAQSKQEMKPLWQKLNWLNSTLTPDYSPGNGFMRGNIHRLTIGEYLYRTPGIIKSLNFSVRDEYSWEIKMDEPEGGRDNDMMELPHAIDVSVNFVPILNQLPKTITKSDFNVSSLITKDIGDNENFIRDKNPFFDLGTSDKLTDPPFNPR